MIFNASAGLAPHHRFQLDKTRLTDTIAFFSVWTGIPLNYDQQLRYSRQIMLEDIGTAGQERLLGSSVLIIGAGGLGSPALLYCAGAGIGRIGIVDHDSVEISNLHRQLIHRTDTIGTFKTESAAAAITALDPDLQVDSIQERFSMDNADSLVKQYDFIISAVDNLETKLLINDSCIKTDKPFCHGGINAYEGQLFTRLPGNGFCLRCLLPENPVPAEPAGLLGYLPGIIGTLQAAEAIRYLSGNHPALDGQLLVFDGQSLSSRVLTVNAQSDCPVCAMEKI